MKKLLKDKTLSPHENAGDAHSQHESVLEEAHSHGERNKTTCSNTPLSNEQDSSANADSVCSLEKESVVLDTKTKNFNWLTKNGCNIQKAVEVATTYSSEELQKAIAYTETAARNAKKKLKSFTNPMAYLIKTLENKWWMQKTC